MHIAEISSEEVVMECVQETTVSHTVTTCHVTSSSTHLNLLEGERERLCKLAADHRWKLVDHDGCLTLTKSCSGFFSVKIKLELRDQHHNLWHITAIDFEADAKKGNCYC